MRLADGRLTPIENLKPGDRVASIKVPGLEVDVPYRAQYNWLSHARGGGLRGTRPTNGRVASVRLGEHRGFVVINRRIKATPEHPFLVRRSDEWGFASAELLQPGDYLVGERLAEERVQTVERVDAPARTVAVHIPGTNTFSAEGVWVHNDVTGQSSILDDATQASSGSGSSGSGSGSGSGSSGSSSGSSGKSSGSSSFSSSGSGSGSGSGSSGSGSGTIATP